MSEVAPDRFLLALPYTMRQECNVYTGEDADWNNPHNFDVDSGGPTQCGITQRELDAWCHAQHVALHSVRKIKPSEGLIIYRTYWEPHCPLLPPGLDLSVFDENVNAGSWAGMMLLQHVLGVVPDGIWGPVTQGAVNALADVPDVISRYALARRVRYESTRDFAEYGKDWLRRASMIEQDSLALNAQEKVT